MDAGEWERASGTALADAVKYTVMKKMAPFFPGSSLQLGTYAKSIEQVCVILIPPRL